VNDSVKACPNEADISQRIKLAVSAAEAKLTAKYRKKSQRLHRKIKTYTAKCNKQKQKLAISLAKWQEVDVTDKSKFQVELKQARAKAKIAVSSLHEKLKEMMLTELKQRETKVELLSKTDVKEKDGKAKQKHDQKMQEERQKKEQQDKDLAEEKAAKSKEAITKKREAKERGIKEDAAAEARSLNRKTVMLSARKAMQEARIAGQMARKMSHDADTTLENARLKKAKKMAEGDIQALAKLRQHEDLAQTAVDSAREKKEKIARIKYTATYARDKAEKRSTRLAKQDQWEKKRVATLSHIAIQARANAASSKVMATSAAEAAGLSEPVIKLPPRVGLGAVETKKEGTAHEEREVARMELIKADVPIPPGLEPGAMAELEKERTTAAVESGPAPADASATVMKQPELPPVEGASPEGHALRDRIRAHTKIESTKIKTKIAEVKLETALVKRSIARKALEDEGKAIPESLKKGGLDAEKKKLEAAQRKAAAVAEKMESKETSSASDAMQKVEETKEKREETRESLEKEGLPIPDNLKKGGMDAVTQELETEAAAPGGSITDPKPNDSSRTVSVKQQSKAIEADLRAQQGVEQTELAKTLRKKARNALKLEDKKIPEKLKRKTFRPIMDRANAALQKAKKLKVKAGLKVVNNGVGPPGVTLNNAVTCYEADLSKFSSCKDYASSGYTCSSDHQDGKTGYCAADQCINDCKACAKAAPSGHVVDVTTGRCRAPESDDVTQL